MVTMVEYIHRPGDLPVPSAARGSARRRREEGGRRYGMMMRFTGPEYDALAALAADAGLSVPRYLVDSALAEAGQPLTASPAVMAEITAVKRLVANAANNINQIARKLNSGAAPDASIAPSMAAARYAMSRLDVVLDGIDRHRGTAPPRKPSQPRCAQDQVPRQGDHPETCRNTRPRHRNDPAGDCSDDHRTPE
jgi:Bacterial mobilisation protein (MobC)